ncbi:MAG: trehalase [Bacteroidetes bacterium]|nr:MAG: trehalase [Bacteroidota bacterium]
MYNQLKINYLVLFLAFISGAFSACKNAGESPASAPPANEANAPDHFGDEAPFWSELLTSATSFNERDLLDAVPKSPVSDIRKAWESQKQTAGFDPQKFVTDHFDLPASSGFMPDTTRNIAEHIAALWPLWTRPAAEDAGTFIGLPYPYVVRTASERTLYYADSYFTMLGLQAAGKTELLEQMVRNFAALIDRFGYVPTGNRTYYLGQSGPPYFALMVDLLAETKGDEVYAEFLPQLEKEYAFWMAGMETLSPTNRLVRRLVRLGDGTVLNRYWSPYTTPREWHYRADVQMVTAQAAARPAGDIYRDLRAMTEAGWGYSSRWFKDGVHRETTHTTEILPVDLNALLYHLETTLANTWRAAGDAEKGTVYDQRAEQRRKAVLGYLYHGPAGFFIDLDFPNGEPTYVPTLAGLFPLFFEMVPKEYALAVVQNVEEDFVRPGGLVLTPHYTKEAFDSPNGAAAWHWLTLRSLRNYGYDELADKIESYWLTHLRKAYAESHRLTDWYNVQTLEPGIGAYPHADGYAPTAAVFLKLIEQ